MHRILLIEPGGGYIRLDRCMQSIDSWGGAYRFPLNLARIGAHLITLGYDVSFVDLQADSNANLINAINTFKPTICIMSCGFPSMNSDSDTAKIVKSISQDIHVSTFGVAPTLLNEAFLDFETWGFAMPFDSIVVGGEPALGYEDLLKTLPNDNKKVIHSTMNKVKAIDTTIARPLFNHQLYLSPFSGQTATYIEGSYGCPFRCSFCVVPVLYEGKFSKRTPVDIINEFKYVIENNGVRQVTLWDEGTTFQKKFINELCDGLIELRKSNQEKFKNFTWTTRSTTALLDEDITEKMYQSGLSGITLGIESFDETVLGDVEKKISIASNYEAIRLLKKFGIISIGHFIIGHLQDTKESIEHTINSAVKSDLNFAQFYCAVPYPGTKLYRAASSLNLIQEKDLTKYELSNPIMDTIDGVRHFEVGEYRNNAIHRFWTPKRWDNLNQIILKHSRLKLTSENKKRIVNWNLSNPLSSNYKAKKSH